MPCPQIKQINLDDFGFLSYGHGTPCPQKIIHRFSMKNLCVKFINFYRKNISPYKPQCCRFNPTCSEYARQAFLKHGFFLGFILSAYRILRCNPLCKPGFDPVPEKIFGRSRKCRHERGEGS